MLAFAAFVVAAVSCGQKKVAEVPQKKVLVLYYSQT